MTNTSSRTPTGPNIWVDRELAILEDLNPDRMVAYYAAQGINIVLGVPVAHEDGTRTCPCCTKTLPASNRYWRRGIDQASLQPLCRVCEQTELAAPSQADRLTPDQQEALRQQRRAERATERAAAGLPPLTRDHSADSREAARRVRDRKRMEAKAARRSRNETA